MFQSIGERSSGRWAAAWTVAILLNPVSDHLVCPSISPIIMQTPLPPFLVEFLETAPLEQKHQLLDALAENIATIEADNLLQVDDVTDTNQMASLLHVDISELVEHVPDLALDPVLSEGILAELESLHFKGPAKKVTTQWISPSSDSYNYGSIVNKPIPIDKFPNILKLRDIVNQHPSSTSDMDACLVSCFPTYKASLSLHKDDEELISQTSSICTVSFGAPRSLEFVLDGKKKNGRNDLSADLSLPATNGSMNVMKPGSQFLMKHRVKAGHYAPGGSIRYSISFRKISLPSESLMSESSVQPIPITPIPKKSTASLPKNTTSLPKNTTSCSLPKKNIVLVAGDSFPARLDAKRLGKGKKEVRIIAKGGRKITEVQKSIETFVVQNPTLVVQKLFISIGTNDIRNCMNGIKHLKNAVCDLMKSINKLFPSATVYFQAIPPLHHNGCYYTAGNVLSMNNLIYSLCSRFRVYYINIFDAFLDRQGLRNSRLFPEYDSVRNLYDIHPNSKGMGVLAKFYIFLIHSRWFNPMGY